MSEMDAVPLDKKQTVMSLSGEIIPAAKGHKKTMRVSIVASTNLVGWSSQT